MFHHLTYYHKFEIDENEGSFRCDQQNNRKHESIKSFKCQLCDYATNNNGKLNKHMEKAHDDKSVEEKDCMNKNVTPENTSHFNCGICHATFPDEAALFSHLREEDHNNINDQKERGLKMSPAINKTLKSHLCGLCTNSLATRQLLRIHLKEVHQIELSSSFETESPSKGKNIEVPGDICKKKVKTKPCPICPFVGHNITRHIRAVHDKIKDLLCDKCDFETSDESNLRRHYKRKHGGAIPEKAEGLRVRFKKKDSTENQELWEEEGPGSNTSDKVLHEETPKFTCGICSSAFHEEEGLFEHLRECTPDEISTQKQVDNDSEDDEGDSCKNTSSMGKGMDASEDLMEPEVKVVHSLNNDMIKKEQETASDLTNHGHELDTTNKNVMGENLSVQVEEEEFDSDDDELLEQLVEVVPSSTDEMFQGEEEVPVSSSPKEGSPSPTAAVRHKNQCPSCPYIARNASYLKRHVKSLHHKIKDLKCDHCDYETSYDYHLTSHLQRMHSIDAPSKNAISVVQGKQEEYRKTCRLCPFIALGKSIMKRHVKAVHTIKELKCEHCEYLTSDHLNLRMHYKRKHKLVLSPAKFFCQCCDYKTARSRALRRHEKTVHGIKGKSGRKRRRTEDKKETKALAEKGNMSKNKPRRIKKQNITRTTLSIKEKQEIIKRHDDLPDKNLKESQKAKMLGVRRSDLHSCLNLRDKILSFQNTTMKRARYMKEKDVEVATLKWLQSAMKSPDFKSEVSTSIIAKKASEIAQKMGKNDCSSLGGNWVWKLCRRHNIKLDKGK